MTLPKISVVTPSLNQARFLEETIESIHGQGYPNLEHIVIDGGSEDGTVDILARNDSRIAHWVSEPDAGQTDALAKGFSWATGDILCWLNSDDLFSPTTLREVAEFFAADRDTRFVYGDSQWIDIEGNFIKPKREHRWNRFVWLNDHNYIPQPSTFWTSGLFEEVGGLDTSFDLAMDADLWIRFSEVTRPRHSGRVWSSMRFYAEQKNTRMRERSIQEMQVIRDRYQEGSSRLAGSVRRIGARPLRITLKALEGGYGGGELRRHLPHLLGRGSWETSVAESPEDQSS
ncbi:MAG: glycosyltransferase family 2 protein [Acidimicrobiia bacterium]